MLAVPPAAAEASQHHAQSSSQAERCRITDPGLAELSGLASDGRSWYAVADSGGALRVPVLNPADCSVRDVWTSATDPYDVEDLALAPDGAVWLADTGDNQRRRETVALHVLTGNGNSALYRLSYPDGPHDAEALLLDKSGIPYVVTKEPLGMAQIYRPAAPLQEGKTVPWAPVGTVTLPTTDTPGGPIAGVGTRLVTGGSVSPDGTMVALRTYTEAYLFEAPDGDVVAALRRPPIRIPLPNELQGEAIAWEPDGTLLSASEGQQPVRALSGAAALLRPEPAPSPGRPDAGGTDSENGGTTASEEPSGPEKNSGVPIAPAVVVALGLAALLLFFLSRLRRR